ncbi:uroporphyrinogen-III C-methyltransferase [Colwellia psychrerythraea]|uniref:Uroporphyrinogen-III C-methyltransferase n=1 Tax=Colwellia psychrerythraea TaxID=28229 RepID=A0A099L5H9_COLPS|nr:uroporphyrinogen-III C-methyltransferase [Colwellia psychrerythraea]KGJ97675.1 Uroporphyrinogen-III C-methyltransferase [Colwellia psychrerythraea]
MSDNEVSKSNLSDNSDAEKKEAATLSPGSNAKTIAAKAEQTRAPTSTVTKKVPPSSTQVATKKSSNKTSTIAIVLASVSIFASIGHYIWQQQQTSAQLITLSQKNQQAIQQGQAQLKISLTNEFNSQLQQQHKNTNLSQQSAKKAHRDSDAQIQQLSTQINKLEQQISLRQPSDWLIHEADYLIRVAARTMWLERDTKAAISLLREADNRLKALEQPKFLPIRALVNEDIETLALMPTLNNQEAILTLMALNKQVPSLTLAKVNLAEALDDSKEDFVLSEDIGDWQKNLAKTWQKFLNDFITVRRRAGMVEPLMTPVQQQHLQQNLSLKVQLVQWAASEQKAEIYQQTLLDIQQWLNEFFDMDLAINQKFYNSIEQLKQKTIHYDYPSDLRSLTAIKQLLQETRQGTQPQSRSPKSKTTTQIEQATDKKPTTGNIPKPESEKVSGGQL